MDPTLEALLRESGWLARLAQSMAGDAQRAEDAVQETLLTALQRREEPRRSLRGWLRTVLRGKLIQSERERARRARRERARGADAPGNAPDDVHERLELQEVVARAVGELEEPYRSAIVARYFDDLAPRAIAARAGLPLRTVHTRLERGRAKLRARLTGRLGAQRLGAWIGGLATRRVRWTGTTATLSTGGALMSTWAKLAWTAAGLVGLLWLGRGLLDDGQRDPRTPVEPVAARGLTPVLDAPAATLVAPASERAEDARVPEGHTARAALPEASAEGISTPQPARGGAELRVRVRRESDHRPLAGVRLEVTPLAAVSALVFTRPQVSAQTDALGRGRLRVRSGQPLRLACEALEDPAHPVQPVTLEIEALAPDTQRVLEVVMPDGLDRLFQARVIDAEDRSPLPGVQLRRHPDRGPLPVPGADGAFTLAYASWAPDELEVRCAGHAPQRLDLGRIDHEPGQPFVVALERAAALEARVSGAGEPGALELRVGAKDGREWRAAIDPAGAGTLEELPVRTAFTVELLAQGRVVWRAPEPFSLVPGERRGLEVSLAAGCLLFGTLRDEHGRPVSDQGVVALPASAREGFDEGGFRALQEQELDGAVRADLDGQGGFTFQSLAEGRWWIGPCAGEGSLVPRAIGLEIGPGSHARRLDLRGEHGRTIRGRVLGPDGEPLRACQVIAVRQGDRGHAKALASDGRFEIGPLAEGEYALRAFAQGIFGWGDPVPARAGEEEVELRLGQTRAIGGRVVDEAGRGVQAHVHLLRRSAALGSHTTDEGIFLFTGLEPGSYSVTAEMPDGRVAVVPAVLEGEERVDDLVLELRPGGRVVVRHGRGSAVRVSIWCGPALAADFTVQPGEESLAVVPAGPLRVELYGGGRTLAERALVARPQRVETVVFE